jgi:UDP-N-acetylmuramyl pentapeptide synthase
MRLSNPVLITHGGVEPVVVNGKHRIPSPACLRVEPAFLFHEKKTIDGNWLSEEGEELGHESCVVGRESITWYVVVPTHLSTKRLRFRATCEGKTLLDFDVEVVGHASPVAAAAFVGEQRRAYSNLRDRSLNRPFTRMLDDAANALRAFGGRLVSVTGSVGKTTTKELIAHILRAADAKVYQSTDSWNFTHEICAQIMLNAKWSRTFVSEMAIGEHLPTVGRLLPPDVMVFTHLGTVHTENFPNITETGRLKASLASNIPEGGTVIFNADVPLIGECIDNALGARIGLVERVGYSVRREECATVWAERGPTGKAEVILVDRRRSDAALRVSLEACRTLHPGSVAAAYSVAQTVGIRDIEFVEAVRTFSGVPGRLEEVAGTNTLLVNDAYNANPISMREFLDAMAAHERRKGSVRVILGEMADLGERTPEEHVALVLEARSRFASLILIGRTFCRLGYDQVDWCRCYENLEALRREQTMSSLVDDFQVIGVKGSYCTNLLSLASDIRRHIQL